MKKIILLSKKKASPYGAELVTNGGFDTDTDWEKSTGSWTIGSGIASYDSVSTNTGIRQTDATFTEPLKINTDYKLIFTISNAGTNARIFPTNYSGSVALISIANYANGDKIG